MESSVGGDVTAESTKTVINNSSDKQEATMGGAEILQGVAILCGCLFMLAGTIAGCIAIFRFVF